MGCRFRGGTNAGLSLVGVSVLFFGLLSAACGCGDDEPGGGGQVDAPVVGTRGGQRGEAVDVGKVGDPVGEADGEEDGGGAGKGDGGRKTSIRGKVWTYFYTERSQSCLGLDWGAGAKVTTVGLSREISAKADLEGAFRLEGVPVGERIYLRATGLDGVKRGVSALFEVRDGTVVFLLMATEDLISKLGRAWGVSRDVRKAMILSVVAEWDRLADPPVRGFVGGAAVRLSPEIDEEGFRVIYLDPSNLSSTSRASTHPDRSLLFGFNVPVTEGMGGTRSATTTHPTYTFQKVELPVEAGAITSVVIAADSR